MSETNVFRTGIIAAVTAELVVLAACGQGTDATLIAGRSVTSALTVDEILAEAPTATCPEGSTCDSTEDPFEECADPPDFTNVRCHFDKSIFEGAAAYAKAFSFASPPTAEMKATELGNAAGHFAYAVAYITLALRRNPTPAELAYGAKIGLADEGEPFATKCSYVDYLIGLSASDRLRLIAHIHEHYYARALRALKAYLEVTDALVTLRLSFGDVSTSEYPDYVTQRQKEFESRSLALEALFGERAMMPACTVDPETPQVELALSVLKEKHGDLLQARDALGAAAPWLDVAVAHVTEQALIDDLVPWLVQGSTLPLGTSALAPPSEYHRGLAYEKPERWVCGDGVIEAPPLPEKTYHYPDRALWPDYSIDSEKVVDAVIANAAVSRKRCLPVGSGDDELVGALTFLEALAAELWFSPAEPPVLAPYNHDDALRECLRGPVDGSLRGAYDSHSRASIGRELELMVGTPTARFRTDVAAGKLEYQDLRCTAAACPPRHLLLGRRALEAMATESCEAGSEPCGAAALEALKYEESGWPLAIPFTTKSPPSDGFENPDTADQRWFVASVAPPPGASSAPHPVRQACGADCTEYDWYTPQFADDIFLLRERVPEGGLEAAGQPATRVQPMTFYVVEEAATCPDGEDCFVLRDDKVAFVTDWFSAAEVSYDAGALVTRFRGGSLAETARRVLAREPGRCAELRFNSLGLEKRLVPPLENELIDDGNAYESSFQYYLGRAASAAATASALVESAKAVETQIEASVAQIQAESRLLADETAEAIDRICGSGTSAVGCTTSRLDSIPLGDVGMRDDSGELVVPLLPAAADLVNLGSIVGQNATAEEACADILGAAAPTLKEGASAEVFGTYLDDHAIRMRCTAYFLIRDAGQMAIRRIPELLADADMNLEEQAQFGGQYLQTMLALENQLIEMSTTITTMSSSLQSMAERLDGAKSHLSSIMTSDTGKVANTLEVVGSAAQAAGNAFTSGSFFSVAGTAVATVGRFGQLSEQYRKEEAAADAYVHEFIGGLLELGGQLRASMDRLEIDVNQLTSLSADLDALELEQEQQRNRANRALERVKLGSGIYDTHVWMNATRSNYAARRAVRTAQRLAFVARKAVELRLVVDLERETLASALIESSDRWANDIFLLETRTASDGAAGDDESPQPLPAGEDPFTLATTAYIDKLTDFVGFYAFVYPFQSSIDTAVLSLKDDFMRVQLRCDENGMPIDDFGNPASLEPCRCMTSDGEVDVSVSDLDFWNACETLGGSDWYVLAPYDYDGVLLRQRLAIKCLGGGLVPYGSDACTRGVEYYQVHFPIPLGAIENGSLSSQGQIAAGRYNYRWENVSVNLVGSNIKDCSLDPASSASCYGSAFIPFTLEHGGKVALQEHGGQLRSFVMSTARVQHGKALAAERMLTSPLSQADAALIEQYASTELRGRPLQGSYVLRLYKVPSLAIGELEDVQLLVRYRSWTAFDSLR